MIDADTDWYIRHRISEALYGVASDVRLQANTWRFDLLHQAVLVDVANAIDNHASKMRGKLQAEAERESRELEDAAER